MKKLIIIFIISIITVSCNTGDKKDEKVRYTQNSEEINTLKEAIQDYENGDWESYRTHFADTAKMYYNSNEAKDINAVLASHKESISGLSSYEFTDGQDEYEMVVTDDEETWVNFWGDWQGTIAENNSMIEIPVHITARFIGGKVVTEHVYFDNSGIIAAFEKLQANNAMDSINNQKN